MKRMSDAGERNKGPILDVLAEVLPKAGTVLEIASGPGQHIAHFAAHLPDLAWQPSEANEGLFRSIEAWRQELGLDNLLAPVVLDAAADWPVASADAIVCINMIHIAPWSAGLGLLDGAARLLPDGGILYLYGPYKVGGRHTAPSNEAFDASLRASDPAWGIRNLDDVALEARRRGLHLIKTVKMPANNLSVVFRKTAMIDG